MYRTNDPRFRRRLNEIGQTLENANVTAQSSLYIFGQNYVKPCVNSIGACVGSCVDASCPGLHQRDRLRRQRGRGRGRAELSFDFYDDWDEEENDALLGWGNDEFDRLVAGGGGGVGAGGGGSYGTVTQTQPARQRGMIYPKPRRKSMSGLPHDGDSTGSSFFSRLFGSKAPKYKPSAAGLQEHPGSRRLERDLTEGEALLAEHDYFGDHGGRHARKSRMRSGTASSDATNDSFSSRGDIFPSDDEHDAVPLDDEFAMVLERRISQNDGISGRETESSTSVYAASKDEPRGKRPSAGSRTSTRRTFSSRSSHSGKKSRSRPSSEQHIARDEEDATLGDSIPSISELKHEDRPIPEEVEEAAETAGIAPVGQSVAMEDLSGKEATPQESIPLLPATVVDESNDLTRSHPYDDMQDQSRPINEASHDRMGK